MMDLLQARAVGYLIAFRSNILVTQNNCRNLNVFILLHGYLMQIGAKFAGLPMWSMEGNLNYFNSTTNIFLRIIKALLRYTNTLVSG